MRVLNLFGGPSSGKSTNGKLVSGILSAMGLKTELVEEYAKGLVHAQHTNMFEQQELILAEQNKKQKILEKHNYDLVITDSPLLLINIYKDEYNLPKYPLEFEEFIKWRFNTYDNINIFLERELEYDENGRVQTEDEANRIEKKIKKYLDDNNYPYITIKSKKGLSTSKKIIKYLEKNNIIDKQSKLKLKLKVIK